MKHDLTTPPGGRIGGQSEEALECPLVGPLGLGRGTTTRVPEEAPRPGTSAAVLEYREMTEGFGSPSRTSFEMVSVLSGSRMTAIVDQGSELGSARVEAVTQPGKKNQGRKVTFDISPSVAVIERRAHRRVLRPKSGKIECAAVEQATRPVCPQGSRRREGRPPSADSTTQGPLRRAAEAEARFPTRVFRAKRGAATPVVAFMGATTPSCEGVALADDVDPRRKELRDVMPRREDSGAHLKRSKVLAESAGAAGVGRPTNSSGPEVELLTHLSRREGVLAGETGTPECNPFEPYGSPGLRTESSGILRSGTNDSVGGRGALDDDLIQSERCEELAEVAAGSSNFFSPPPEEKVGDVDAGEEGDVVPLRHEMMLSESTKDSSVRFGQPSLEMSPVGPVEAGRPTSTLLHRGSQSLHPLVGEGARSKRPVGPRVIRRERSGDGVSASSVATPSAEESAVGMDGGGDYWGMDLDEWLRLLCHVWGFGHDSWLELVVGRIQCHRCLTARVPRISSRMKRTTGGQMNPRGEEV
ncbi:hypothetical protein HPB47_015805 [Ixodes persulcatus]|uniref:Uncharacterized protein n=1 Tax=Ixodes persulcatus TaxID=34615 RepID=A0AC60QTG0_IXOPE|nr:hypothetical protein HPB47_015805 [Ixodes persulcatus]